MSSSTNKVSLLYLYTLKCRKSAGNLEIGRTSTAHGIIDLYFRQYKAKGLDPIDPSVRLQILSKAGAISQEEYMDEINNARILGLLERKEQLAEVDKHNTQNNSVMSKHLLRNIPR